MARSVFCNFDTKDCQALLYGILTFYSSQLQSSFNRGKLTMESLGMKGGGSNNFSISGDMKWVTRLDSCILGVTIHP